MTLYSKFLEFHHENPRVFQLIERFADEVIQRGFQRFGIAPIWERVRWFVRIETGDSEFKMPNNHRAYYARLWLDRHPERPGFFETNKLRSGEQWQRVETFHDSHQSL